MRKALCAGRVTSCRISAKSTTKKVGRSPRKPCGNYTWRAAAYWASNLPELTARANLWIYGHSHDNISTYIGDTRFVSNQRGYSRSYDAAEQRDYNREHYVLI